MQIIVTTGGSRQAIVDVSDRPEEGDILSIGRGQVKAVNDPGYAQELEGHRYRLVEKLGYKPAFDGCTRPHWKIRAIS